MGLNHGLGSPTFFVYGPLPYYVCALLEPLARTFHFSAYNLAAFLALLGSGICAFLWLHTLVASRAALSGAALYMLMPYHLPIDFYHRSALPECWALVWMPLVLYFTAGVLARRRYALVGLSAAYALLIFSHLFSTLIFSSVPLAAAVALSSPGERVQSGLRVSLAMMLGAGLSSVYLFSSLYHERYIPAARLAQLREFYWADNFIRFGNSLFAHSTPIFLRTVSWVTLSTIVLTAICGVAAFAKTRSDSRRLLVFWLALSALAVLLMSRLSEPLWHSLPRLQALQFPWRFNVLLCVASLPVLAMFLSEPLPADGFPQVALLAAVLLILISWLLAFGEIWRRYETEIPPPEPSRVIEYDELSPAWWPPNANQTSALSASTGPPVRFMDGTGSAEVLVWQPRHLKFQTSSVTGGWVMANQFYYPAWRAELIDQSSPVEIRPAVRQGLLELRVPPGSHLVQVDIPVGWAERAGRWISASCLLLCLFLAAAECAGTVRPP
jgi:hypothetical protein